MRKLIKSKALKQGDVIATISLSWGGASQFKARYEQGKKQFEEAFGVKIIETPHALCSAEEIYNHPEWRLDDLMWAFKNPEIKAILTNIGGDDTIRLLRHMTDKHFEVIKNNPKIFLGMSDTTVNHFMCFKAGISSFYSACTLFGYAENGGIPEIMIENTKKTLFSTEMIGELPISKEFIVDRVWFGQEDVIRPRTPTQGWRFLGGNKKTQGRLIGGCLDVLDFINGTSLWPSLNEWEDSILFVETSEDMPSPEQVGYWLRGFGAQGILEKLKGILFARPGGEFLLEENEQKNKWLAKYEDYDKIIFKILKEYGCDDLPVVTNMDFGHTVPQLILPYGIRCEINPENQTVSILENAVE